MAELDPAARVCPRCGAAADDHRFCPDCGLNLGAESQLPTRAEWEDSQAEKGPDAAVPAAPPASPLETPGEAEAVPPRAGGLAGLWSRAPRDAKIGAVIGLLAVVALVIILATSGGDSSNESSRGNEAGAPRGYVGPPPEERCTRLWNSDANSQYRDTAKSIVSLGQQDTSNGYAAVGFAVDYPDKCLITIVNSATGAGFQFLEGGYGNEPFSIHQTNTSALPDSAKQWNATIESDGTLALG